MPGAGDGPGAAVEARPAFAKAQRWNMISTHRRPQAQPVREAKAGPGKRRGRRGRLWGCAAALALTAAPLHAASVLFTFQGQITSVASVAANQTSFQVGDRFTLVLDFTPGGPTPAFGYFLGAGNAAVNPESLTTPVAPYGGIGPPYGDTLFQNPEQYRLYCEASLSLVASVLSFKMRDEDTGPSGSVEVGADFPTDWFSHMSDPLPNGTDQQVFSAHGTLNFNFLNTGGIDLKGDITSAEISTAAPLPSALLTGLVGMVGVVVLRRRWLGRRL
jgi:hypothetical protein